MKIFFRLVHLFLVITFSVSYSQSNFDENPVSPTPAVERLKSFQKKMELREKSLFKNVEFRSVGPTVMSGRVVDVDVSPTDPSIFYVAYASGGVWKTSNNGVSFFPVFENEVVISVGDIAVDWKNNIIYVGTGENNSSRSSYSGTGIYKSTNDGKEWTNIGLIETHRIGRIVIDPINPERIWVAALGHLFSPNPERGIYLTNDGGRNWKQTLVINDNTGGIDLCLSPDNSNILYSSMWFRERRAWHGFESGVTSGIFKSLDGGNSWVNISGKDSGIPIGEGTGRIGLAVFPKNPNIIYAVLDNLSIRDKKEKKSEEKITKELLRNISKEDFLKLSEDDLNDYLDQYDFPKKYTAISVMEMVRNEKIKPIDLADYVEDAESIMFNTEVVGAMVFRSDNAGKTWEKMNEKYIDDMFYTYGYYFGNIRVSPVNPDKIYILGVPVLKSEDGGRTYKSLSESNAHSDHHALWINPNRDGHLILGNDGGINISYDDGNTWFKANTPAVGQFYSVNVDMEKPYNVYGGLQDNGVWYGPSNYQAGYSWYARGEYPYKSIMGGDGMQVAIDTRDNNTVYTGYQFGNYYRVNKKTGEYKYITPKHELGEKQFRFNWQSPIQISIHNQDIIYLGSNKLHRSLNKGENFEVISPDLTNGGKKGKVPYGTLTTISESSIQYGLIYTGSDDGAVYVTKNGGYNWEKISDDLPEYYWISRVQSSAFDVGTVYVTLNGFRWDNFEALLYRSIDYGEHWEKIGLDLPLGSVNVIKEDPVNKKILYAGTDNGIYISINSGKNFMEIYKGLPNVPVHDLVIHPREKELVIGTHGRSIYIADVKNIEKLTGEILSKELHLFETESITYDKNWGKKDYTWGDYSIPSVNIIFYSKNVNNGKIKILTEDNNLIYEQEINFISGLNFYKYNLSVDEGKQSEFQKYLENKYKGNAEISENGKLYLRPGVYNVEIVSGGNSEFTRLEVKEPKKTKRGEM